VIDPTDTQQWKELSEHSSLLEVASLEELLNGDPSRIEDLSFEVGSLHVDFSKQLVTKDTIDKLVALGNELKLSDKIHGLFAGEIVNVSENRPALHTALRFSEGSDEGVSGVVRDELERASDFSLLVRSGKWVGATGKPITTVINIGIGGSHLGPLMANAALRPFRKDSIKSEFVSNIDPADIDSKLHLLDPETTLFIINSKSFTTTETITNAEAAIQWLINSLGTERDSLERHVVAVTANSSAAESMGLPKENIFTIWDWVGGRFSICSSVSLAVMISIGPENFQLLLDGANSIDEHFKSTDLSENIPVLMALIAIWNRNFLDYGNHALLSYSEDLKYFPSYLEQLEMESNGKQLRVDGEKVTHHTSPVVLGGIGTDAQHSFFQLLHQGTTTIPSDFIVFCKPSISSDALSEDTFLKQHEILVANCFAQSKALAIGSGRESGEKKSDGNRPSTTILGTRLDPYTLGQLVALYEHKVFTMGAIWQINSFDQDGVQIGKSLAASIENDLSLAEDFSDHDASTQSLLSIYQQRRGI